MSVYFVQHDGNRYRWNTEFKWSEAPEGKDIPLNPGQPQGTGY